ncbi:MAG: hypothetical protein MI743_10080 [Sneathiellales bacterium]|nr:hypothetical protein [Sneathiellales bacterium]
MPLIHVTADENTLGKDDQDNLMSEISRAVLKAEGAPVDDNGANALVWAYYDARPAQSTYIGGQAISAPPIRINITTPEGALNAENRHQLVKDLGEIVDRYVGIFEGRLNHWTMMHEVTEGSWAGAGQIFHLADIQSAMNISAA